LGSLFSNKAFAIFDIAIDQHVTDCNNSGCSQSASLSLFQDEIESNLGHSAISQDVNCTDNSVCAQTSSNAQTIEGLDNTVAQDSLQTETCSSSTCSEDSSIFTAVVGNGNTVTAEGVQTDECTNAD